MKKKDELAALKSLFRMMADDPNCPEKLRMEIKTVNVFDDLRETLSEATRIATTQNPPAEVTAAWYEYLLLMRAGLDSFLAANPALKPAETEAPNE